MTTQNTQTTTKPKRRYGKWITVTKGKFAGQKRYLNRDAINAMKLNGAKRAKALNAEKATVTPAKPGVRHTSTGTNLRLSQETATLVSNHTEGLTLEEAVEHALRDYFAPGVKLVKSIQLTTEK